MSLEPIQTSYLFNSSSSWKWWLKAFKSRICKISSYIFPNFAIPQHSDRILPNSYSCRLAERQQGWNQFFSFISAEFQRSKIEQTSEFRAEQSANLVPIRIRNCRNRIWLLPLKFQPKISPNPNWTEPKYFGLVGSVWSLYKTEMTKLY